MACGLKKQNTESGVHLTERTCSPYNPIIRLMVDDCLGLPIYPVSSIDAVIDEDGNTLRKLLEDLLDKIKSGSTDLAELIKQIQVSIEYILNHYVTNTDLTERLSYYTLLDTFNELKTLVQAISGLKKITDSNLLNYVYESDDNTEPHIVHFILALKKQLDDLIGGGSGITIDKIVQLLLAVANFNENIDPDSLEIDGLEDSGKNTIKIIQEILDISEKIGNEGDDDSILGRIDALEEMLNNIKALLLAVAEYDGETNVAAFSGFTLLTSGANTQNIIEIVYQIKKLWEEIGGGENPLIDRVEALEEASKTHAHLDPYVLKLMPESGNFNPEVYLTLKIGEYPPDTIDIIDRSTINARRTGLQRLEYYKELLETETASGEFIYDVYPFCHTDLDKGLPLYFRDNNNNYTPVVNGNGVQLRAGDGKINLRDVALLIDISKGLIDDPLNLKIYKDGELLSILDVSGIERPSEIYKKLYWGNTVSSNEPALYGDVNTDGQNGNNGDISAAINYVISKKIAQLLNSPETINLPSNHSEDSNFGYLFYYENNKLAPSAIYPCIEGKLYLDYFTNNIYQFSLDEMNLVNYPKFTAEGNIEINDTYTVNYPKHRKITISTPRYTAGSGVNINEGLEGELEISIDPSAIPTVTNYVAGAGINIAENLSHQMLISLDTSVIPEATNYVAGQGIQITQVSNQNAKEVSAVPIVANSDDTFLKLTSEYDENTPQWIINLGLEEIIVYNGRSNALEGEYFIQNEEAYVLCKPDTPKAPTEPIYAILKKDENTDNRTLLEYGIGDVSGVIDLLLEGGNTNTLSKLKILQRLDYEVSKKYTNNNLNLTRLLDLVRTIIQNKSNELLNSSSPQSSTLYYYCTYTNPAQPGVNIDDLTFLVKGIQGDYYRSKVLSAVGDLNDDLAPDFSDLMYNTYSKEEIIEEAVLTLSTCSIADVSYIIDALLGGTASLIYEARAGKYVPKVKKVTLGLMLYKKGSGNASTDTQIYSDDYSNRKIFRVRIDNKDVWYYFSKAGEFVPVDSDYTIELDLTTGTLTLNKDGSAHSSVTFPTEQKPTGGGTSDEGTRKIVEIDRPEFINNDSGTDILDSLQIKLTHKYNETSLLMEDETEILEIPSTDTYNLQHTPGINIDADRHSKGLLEAIGAETLSLEDTLPLSDFQREGGYTRTKYFTCLDIPYGKVKFVQQTTTYSVPTGESDFTHLEYTSIIRVLSNENIDTSTIYHVKDINIYYKFDLLNGYYIPSIVTVPRHSIDIAVDDNSEYIVLPGEIPNIATNGTTIKLNIDTLKDVPGYEAIEIRGKFVIHDEPSNSPIVLLETLELGENPSYEQAYDCPAILRGKTYEFSLFNGVFKYSRVTNS